MRRPLPALRRLGLDAGRWLGSWRLSVVLMVLAALFHLFLAAWAYTSPSHVVRNIAGLAPFWLVYGLLLVNTAVCFTRRWRALSRRGRRAAAGSYLFHGALFVLALGFLLSLATRQEVTLWAATGETFTGEEGQVLSMTPPRWVSLPQGLPTFRVDRVEPELWRDQLLFTRLEADLTLLADGGGGGRPATTRINRPLWLGWGTFLRLSGFGYAPRYELTDRAGATLDSAFVKMNVFPPGQRDHFRIPDLPHRFYLEVLPDFAVEEGEPITRSLELVRPAVWLRVVRGPLELGEALVRRGDAFGFEGLRLRFPEIRYWGQFSLVRDPGAPVIFLGYLLGLAGLALKLWADAGAGGTPPGRRGSPDPGAPGSAGAGT